MIVARRHRAALASALIAIALSAVAAPARADYSDYAVASAGASLSSTQAGAHADLTTAFTIATDPASETDSHGYKAPYARTKDLIVNLPPGLIGNPNSVAQCTPVQFATAFSGGGCPNASQVGVVRFSLYQYNQAAFYEPVYNMVPPGEGDTVARLGVYAASLPTFINISVRSEDDYGLTATLEGLNATAALVTARTTIWGVPAAPGHDRERQTPQEAFNGVSESPPKPPGGDPAPFLSNPTRCGVPQQVSILSDSYQLPGQFAPPAIAPLPAIDGCDEVEFHPSLAVTPTSHEAAAPTGLDASLSMPQNETVGGLATSQLRDAVVTLPRGMTIAAGAADGLAACSEQQVGYKTRASAHCPDAARIGSAEIDVPALSRILHGAIYQRTPEPGHLFRLGQIRAQRPLAQHRLSGLQAGHDQIPVPGHPHADDDEVDLGIRGHVAEPVESPLGAERRGGRLGGVLVRGADRLQLIVGQSLEGGNVGVGAPAAAALCHGCAHDSDSNLVRHLNLPVRPFGESAAPPARRAARALGRRIVAV